MFGRKSIKAPDYHKKMKMAFEKLRPKGMILGIKALNREGKNIASSYYIGNQYLVMFASNASYTEYLKICPNQALMWYAIKYWKSKGAKVMDMGGSGSYKGNFGAVWKPKPIIIYSKHKWEYIVILGAKRWYAKFLRIAGETIAKIKKENRKK